MRATDLVSLLPGGVARLFQWPLQAQRSCQASPIDARCRSPSALVGARRDATAAMVSERAANATRARTPTAARGRGECSQG